MPVQIKKFSSILDTDLSEAEVDYLAHTNALNVTFRGNAGMMRVQNIIGNTPIPNTGLPGSGTDQTIGAFYDQVKQRLIWFNWNSNALHGIYIYNTASQTVQTLLVNGAATDGDILGFTQSGPILSIVIIYQEIADGDILCFLDSQGRPCSLNINRYLTNPYPVTKRAFIDLAKAPPRMPARVTLENDANVTVNNQQNALFKFRYRFVFDDYQKSVYSTGSITPLPNILQNFGGGTLATASCRTRVIMSTGDIDVTYIELWGQQATDDVSNSNWFLIGSFEKSTLGIASNDVYQFLFYNDGLYPSADPEEIVELFDYVPIYANALELLNGNTIIMGGITEGYNPVTVNATVTTSNIIPPNDIKNGVLFAAFQGGVDSYGTGNQIDIYLTGAGTNDGSGNPTTAPMGGTTFYVDCVNSSGTSLKFSYTYPTGDSITAVLNGLSAAAVAKGFTVVSQTQNVLSVSYSGVVLYYADMISNSNTSPFDEAQFQYTLKGAYDWSLCYFDTKGRTIGAQLPINNQGSVNTLEDLTGATSPLIVITINSRPPAQAAYYSICRSPNLVYNKYLNWICDQTFVNTDLDNNSQYAYIGYSNMDLYNSDIQTSNPGGTPVVGYTFQQGDRIRFQLQYPVGNTTGVQLSDSNDYQIVSVETNPIINGVMQLGNFIKIIYPTGDINANFQFGGDNYQNYKILIYNFTKRAIGAAEEVYYEFGRMFAIANPGASNNYHIGSFQSQTPTLSQAAIVQTTDGDFFHRVRIVPTGVPYYINVLAAEATTEFFTVSTTNTGGSVVDNGVYQIGQQVENVVTAGTYPQYSPTNADNAEFWNKTANPVSIRFRGTVSLSGDAPLTANAIILTLNSAQVQTVSANLITNFFLAETTTVQAYSYTIDAIFTVPPDSQSWIVFVNRSVSGTSQLNVGAFTGVLNILNYITIPVTDASYLDSYNIVTNSNLRAIVYDENAKQNVYSTLLRWSLGDQFGTNINQINRFYFQNQDEIDRSRGAILRFKARDRILRIFQQRGVCQKGVYNTFVQDSEGNNILTVTDAIITINNTLYYEGEYGMGNHPESLVSGKIQDYFVDHIRGYECRLSQDGIVPISEIYKGEYTIRGYFTQYNQPYIYTGNGVAPAFILGCYNYFEEELIRVLQPGTLGSVTIPNYTIAFNEGRNAYASFYSFAPEWIASGEDNFYCWLGGELYIHNNSNSTAPYTTFFGVTYNASITTVFNKDLIEKKTWIGLTQLASVPWGCPLIYTNQYSYGTQQQQSYLVPGCFAYLEGQYNSSLQRDTFSAGGWINGYRLKGSWLAAEFSVTAPTTLVWLSEVSMKYIDSPLTAR